MAEEQAETTQQTAVATDTATATPEPRQAPWGADFDAEKAWKLVQNLRAEVKDLKAQIVDLGDAKKRVSELEDELSQTHAQLQVRDKEKLLAERGLPLNLIGALTGDTSDDWTEMADMLHALVGSRESQTVQPDPVQSAGETKLSGDAAQLALAKQLGIGM